MSLDNYKKNIESIIDTDPKIIFYVDGDNASLTIKEIIDVSRDSIYTFATFDPNYRKKLYENDKLMNITAEYACTDAADKSIIEQVHITANLIHNNYTTLCVISNDLFADKLARTLKQDEINIESLDQKLYSVTLYIISKLDIEDISDEYHEIKYIIEEDMIDIDTIVGTLNVRW